MRKLSSGSEKLAQELPLSEAAAAQVSTFLHILYMNRSRFLKRENYQNHVTDLTRNTDCPDFRKTLGEIHRTWQAGIIHASENHKPSQSAQAV